MLCSRTESHKSSVLGQGWGEGGMFKTHWNLASPRGMIRQETILQDVPESQSTVLNCRLREKWSLNITFPSGFYFFCQCHGPYLLSDKILQRQTTSAPLRLAWAATIPFPACCLFWCWVRDPGSFYRGWEGTVSDQRVAIFLSSLMN